MIPENSGIAKQTMGIGTSQIKSLASSNSNQTAF